MLIAAMMPMSVALTNTGASALVSQSLVNALGTFGPYALLAGIYFTTSLLTMFISNTATAVLMAPIAMHVLCLAVLNAAKRSCHAGRPLHVYGLHSRGSSPSGHNGCCDGVCAAPAFPVLISVNEHLLYYNKATIINSFVIDRL